MTTPSENQPAAPAPPTAWTWCPPVAFVALGIVSLALGFGGPWYGAGWQWIILGALWTAIPLRRYRDSRRAPRGRPEH